MASHVPFLAVRPEEQTSTNVKSRDFASTTSTDKPSSSRKGAVKNAASKVTATARKVEKDVEKTAYVVWQGLRFPLILLSSFGLSAGLHTISSSFAGTGGELASVSRELGKDWQVGAVLAWKALELLGVWWVNYDSIDVASLSLLSNLPFYFFLNSFYELSLMSIGSSLLIDVISMTVPFYVFGSSVASSRDEDLLRPLGKAIAHDKGILLLTSTLATVVFASTLYLNFLSWVPVYIISNFDNIKTLDIVHETGFYALAKLALLCIPAGLAAMYFQFLPTVLASNTLLNALDAITADAPFDPETATLTQTVAYNLGLKHELSAKAEVLMKRTFVLALGSAINTFVRVFGTIEGAGVVGALSWAGLWTLAINTVGTAYYFVAE